MVKELSSDFWDRKYFLILVNIEGISQFCYWVKKGISQWFLQQTKPRPRTNSNTSSNFTTLHLGQKPKETFHDITFLKLNQVRLLINFRNRKRLWSLGPLQWSGTQVFCVFLGHYWQSPMLIDSWPQQQQEKNFSRKWRKKVLSLKFEVGKVLTGSGSAVAEVSKHI